MPATFDCIATTTLSSSASDIVFSNIPQTFTDLMFIFTGQGSASSNVDCNMRFNGDSSALYSYMRIYSGGSTVNADRGNGTNSWGAVAYIGGSNTPNMFASTQINIFNYSSTSANKSSLCQWNSAGTSDNYSLINAGLYRSTSAITSIQIFPQSGSLVAGTTAQLYGIKAA